MTTVLDEIAASVAFDLPDGRVENVKLSQSTFYTGEIRNGMLHGEGVLTTAKDVYNGGFVNNMREGRGKFRATVDPHPSGTKEYDGEWKANNFDGEGTVIWTNGDTYTGFFCDGRPHGPSGHYVFADGRVYKGPYEHGRRHGRGRLTQPNGDYYEGDFSLNAMTGHGIACYAGGKRVFEGSWLNGKKTLGKMTFDGSGLVYDGAWLNEKPHGKGEMFFATGDHYKGDFVSGKPQGVGTMTYASHGGKVITGTFQDGQLHGLGHISMPGSSGPIDAWFRYGRQLSANDSAAIKDIEREVAALTVEANVLVSPPVAESVAKTPTPRLSSGSSANHSFDAQKTPSVSGSEPAPSPSLSMPRLPTLRPDEADSSGSCSRLSRKEEEEIRAVSASVIAGTAHNGCKGWMEKFSIGRSRLGRSNWRRRYFVLASFGKVVSLSYYEDELCRKPVAFLRLDTEDTRIVTRPSPRTHKEAVNPGREICIVYIEKGVNYKLILRADSEEDHDYWCDALRRLFSIIDHPTDYPQLSMARSRNEVESVG